MSFCLLVFCGNMPLESTWYIKENMSDNRKKDVLPEFQAFLLDKKLAQEKNAFFYALWASKFLIYSNKKQIPPDQYQENAVIEFIETMKSDSNVSDWQIRQAGDAIRLQELIGDVTPSFAHSHQDMFPYIPAITGKGLRSFS